MAFDGFGTFLRLRSWVVDATNSVKIRADYHDAEDNNFADGLSHCITKDGQTTVTQNIPFNSRRIISLADPIDPQDAATKDYADTKLAKTGDGTITGNLAVTGNISATGTMSATGYQTRKGQSGPYTAHYFNFDGTGNLEAWVDNTNLGPLATQAYVGAYLPLAGGTITGNLMVNGALISRSTSAGVVFQDSGGTTRGNVFWNPNDNTTALMHSASPVGISIAANAMVFLGRGWRCRGGFSGSYGTVCSNLYWEPGVGMHLYADDMHQGVIAYTSDYRLKKDVADLPDTWDIVKALRPVKYTQAAYGKTVDGADMFTADDVERWGFIAHELQDTMIRTAATGVKDQENLVQSPNPWTIIAALTKTVQELQDRVETLEANQGGE